MDGLLTPATLNEVRESDLIELPTAQSSQAAFPPSCTVWIIANTKVGANFTPTDTSNSISEGVVSSVFIGDVFSAEKVKKYYKVRINHTESTFHAKLVDEKELSYARNTPVYFFDANYDKSVKHSGAAQRGEVLSCRLVSSSQVTMETRVEYTVLLFGEGANHTVRHHVCPQQLQFRLVDECFSSISTQNSDVSSKRCVHRTPIVSSQAPPPGFGSDLAVRNNTHSSLPKQKEVIIPQWLVTSNPDLVKSTISGETAVIEQMTGCHVCFTESNSANQFIVAVHAPDTTSASSVRLAIKTIENKLLEIVIGPEQSKGRFLYDMALSYSEVKADGAVQQRNPFNSYEKVWMNIIDIPSILVGDEMKYNISPYLDGKTYDAVHAANCNLCICKDNFGTPLLSCQPYVLIVGKQAKSVANATAAIKNAVKRYNQRAPSTVINMEQPTRSMPPPLSTKRHVASPFKVRKLTVPSWFVSAFSKQMHEALFQGDQCSQAQVRAVAGCDIMLTQSNLLVRTMPKGGDVNPNISKATDIIENALLDLLGAEESKPRLLYDLTESYSEVTSNGVIQMRNPMQSFDRVWAGIIEIPVSPVDDEGNTKYVHVPFTCKNTDDEMHKLKCTLKLCTDNFGICLSRCKPYAIVIGKQKGNVEKAIEYVSKLVKKYRLNQG